VPKARYSTCIPCTEQRGCPPRRALWSPTATDDTMTLSMTSAFANSSIVEAFQTELVKHTASNTPCAGLMLHRLPQLLQAAGASVENASGPARVAALAGAYAQVHDDMLRELEAKQLLPAVSEVRALARAIHHGILTVLARDAQRPRVS